MPPERGVHRFETKTEIPLHPEEVFPFFAAAENLERITPPELRFRILTPLPIEMGRGTLIEYRLRLEGIPFRWQTEISDWDPPWSFTDRQLRGPYHTWIHRHTFEPREAGTLMKDRVDYRLPLWPLGEPALPLVRRKIARIFEYRTEVIQEILG
jgi:ligand-binding SRPBCC domain-containing protein